MKGVGKSSLSKSCEHKYTFQAHFTWSRLEARLKSMANLAEISGVENQI